MKTNQIRRKLIGTFLAGGFLQACGGGSSANPAAPGIGDSGSSPSTGPEGPIGPTLSGFAGQIMYIAHRGGAALYPEETILAYGKSFDDKHVLLEGDVQTLADGTLGLMHNLTVDDVTTSSGAVSSFTENQWRNLIVDGDWWHGSNFGSLNPALFSEWVTRYKGKAILVPEDKDLKSMAGMLAVLRTANVNKDQVLLQSFSGDTLKLAVAAGYPACFLNNGKARPDDVKASGVKYVGISADETLQNIASWVSSGLSVLMWTVNRRYLRDIHIPLGVKGFFSDDPTYLRETKPLWSADRFDLQTWLPGMLGNNDNTGLGNRGKFLGNGYWGYSQTAYAYAGCMQGYLCPIKSNAEAKEYSLSMKIRFDTALNDDSTRWASVFLGVDDRPFSDLNDAASGHHILFRKNGTVGIYRKAANGTATQLAVTNGTPIRDGEEVSYRIAVTESAISVTRFGLDDKEMYATKAIDTSTRGTYIQLGRSGLACGFRHVAVS
jgi:glycerophosphoryl diester phosphodiesterase